MHSKSPEPALQSLCLKYQMICARKINHDGTFLPGGRNGRDYQPIWLIRVRIIAL